MALATRDTMRGRRKIRAQKSRDNPTKKITTTGLWTRYRFKGPDFFYFGSWSAIRCPRTLRQFTRSAAPWPENWPAIRRVRTSIRQPRPAARRFWGLLERPRAASLTVNHWDIKKAATGAALARYMRVFSLLLS